MVGFAVKLDRAKPHNHDLFYNYSIYCHNGVIYPGAQPYFAKINRGQRVKCYLNLDQGEIFFEVDRSGVLPPIKREPEIVRDLKLFFTVHHYRDGDSVKIIEAQNPQD